MANLTLTAKQQSVLLVLWPCLKAPPRIDVQIGPDGIRLGATFDRTAPGMVCGTVRSEHSQIAVAANLDLATVEVDFDRLQAAAGLASAEEAAHVWESIKDVVSAAASASPASHRSREVLKAGERWEVPEWLYTAARDIQLSAYKADLRTIEAQCDSAVQTAATNVTQTETRHGSMHDRLQIAKDSVRRVASAPVIKNNTRALTAWFVQGLFGNKGLENFYSSQRDLIKQQHSTQHMTPKAQSKRVFGMNLMDRVVGSYQKNRHSTGAYHDCLRLYACFFDQLTSLRRKFWQKGSAEQRALPQWADDRAVCGLSERTDRLKPVGSLQRTAWIWLIENTGQSRTTIDAAIWKGRQIRTMIAVFGEGVLYFMDSRLESELERIKGGSGILISVVKTLDVLLGDELRTLCKTAEKALSDGSQIGDEVRAKHSLIAAVSLDRQAMSKVDSLLADVSHGRVTISTELEDHDDLYAATCT